MSSARRDHVAATAEPPRHVAAALRSWLRCALAGAALRDPLAAARAPPHVAVPGSHLVVER